MLHFSPLNPCCSPQKKGHLAFLEESKPDRILEGTKTGSPKCVRAVSGKKKKTMQLEGNQDNLYVV